MEIGKKDIIKIAKNSMDEYHDLKLGKDNNSYSMIPFTQNLEIQAKQICIIRDRYNSENIKKSKGVITGKVRLMGGFYARLCRLY